MASRVVSTIDVTPAEPERTITPTVQPAPDAEAPKKQKKKKLSKKAKAKREKKAAMARLTSTSTTKFVFLHRNIYGQPIISGKGRRLAIPETTITLKDFYAECQLRLGLTDEVKKVFSGAGLEMDALGDIKHHMDIVVCTRPTEEFVAKEMTSSRPITPRRLGFTPRNSLKISAQEKQKLDRSEDKLTSEMEKFALLDHRITQHTRQRATSPRVGSVFAQVPRIAADGLSVEGGRTGSPRSPGDAYNAFIPSVTVTPRFQTDTTARVNALGEIAKGWGEVTARISRAEEEKSDRVQLQKRASFLSSSPNGSPRSRPQSARSTRSTMATATTGMRRRMRDSQGEGRNSWRGIRIFVSATSSDMWVEREVLQSKVYSDLKQAYAAHRLRLTVTDLRCGMMTERGQESKLIDVSMFELQRAKEVGGEHGVLFLSLLSEKYGWIPDLEQDVSECWHRAWIPGFSLTAMEVIVGAYMSQNPNALFLLRNPSFLQDIPVEYVDAFSDSDTVKKEHLKMLKSQIRRRFLPDQVIDYDVRCEGVTQLSVSGGHGVTVPKMKGLDGEFARSTAMFFRKVLDRIVPSSMSSSDATGSFSVESDLTSLLEPPRRSVALEPGACSKSCVSWRFRPSVTEADSTVDRKTQHFLTHSEDGVMVMSGPPGIGKSVAMARTIQNVSESIDDDTFFFYQFIGCCPRSTQPEFVLARLHLRLQCWNQMMSRKGRGSNWKKHHNDSNAPNFGIWGLSHRSITDASPTDCMAMSLPGALEEAQKAVLIIDGLDQLEVGGGGFEDLEWLPPETTLPVTTKIILSCRSNCQTLDRLLGRYQCLTEVKLSPMAMTDRLSFLRMMVYDQVPHIPPGAVELCKTTESGNRLWLTFAGTLTRITGKLPVWKEADSQDWDRPIWNCIVQMENDLGKEEVQRVLSLLYVSRCGLLEAELADIVAAGATSGKRKDRTDGLFDFEWCSLISGLVGVIRTSREGRITLNHSLVAAVVKRKYGLGAIGNQYRRSIIRYFDPPSTGGSGGSPTSGVASPEVERSMHKHIRDDDSDDEVHPKEESETLIRSSPSIDRKVEELPFQLAKIGDWSSLRRVVFDWSVFSHLMGDDILRMDLFKYWIALNCESHGSTIQGTLTPRPASARELHDTVLLMVDKAQTQSEDLRGEAEVCDVSARFMAEVGVYDIALSLCKNALLIREEDPETGADHPSNCDSLILAASLETVMGRHREGLDRMRSARDFVESLHGMWHPNYAVCTQMIAAACETLNKPAVAEDEYRLLCDVWERCYGQHHPTLASAVSNLAMVCQFQAKLDDALDFHARSLEILQRCVASDHPGVSRAYHNLGTIHLLCKRTKEALPMFECALRGKEAVVKRENVREQGALLSWPHSPGSASPKDQTVEAELDIAATLSMLGILHFEGGSPASLAKARACFKRSLRIRTDLLGARHELTLESKDWLSRVEGER